MAGLPWLIVFGIIAWVGLSRGWTWMTLTAVLCMGLGAADTTAGSAFYGGITNMIGSIWSGVVGALNSVA